MKSISNRSDTTISHTHESKSLSKSLNIVETVSLAASDISPTSGVFLNIPVVIAIAGTGTISVAIIAGIIALCVALTMAEVGSAYPKSGGIYSVIHTILGKKLGFVALIAYLLEGAFIPAVTSMGAATYLVSVFPQLNVHFLAAFLMIIATGIAIMNISSTGKFTTFLLILELIVVLTITVASIMSMHQPLSTLFSNEILKNGSLTKVSLPTLFTAVAVMLFSFNGFDSALNFSEEMKGNSKSVGHSVLGAAGIGILAQVIPLIFIVLAAPTLKGFLGAKNSILFVANATLGGVVHNILSIGIALAMFACTISVLLQFSRVLFTSGRDQMWSRSINSFLQSIHPRFSTPWKATIFLGILDVILNFYSNLSDMISFTSVLVVLLYATVGVCDLIERNRKTNFPYRNTLGLVAPLITIAASLYALSQQEGKNLFISGIILLISAFYAFFFKKEPQSEI